jgi:signal peptidase I
MPDQLDQPTGQEPGLEAPAGDDGADGWYFDLPTGAWERQEEKNRALRESVRQKARNEPRRRDPFAEPRSQDGDWSSAGGTWRLARDEDAQPQAPPPSQALRPRSWESPAAAPADWGVPPVVPGDELDEEAQADISTAMRRWATAARGPATRPASEPAAPSSIEAGDDPVSVPGAADPASAVAADVPEPTPGGPPPGPRLKPASVPDPAPAAPGSRWDDMFGATVPGSIVDSMRDWAERRAAEEAAERDPSRLPPELLKRFDWEYDTPVAPPAMAPVPASRIGPAEQEDVTIVDADAFPDDWAMFARDSQPAGVPPEKKPGLLGRVFGRRGQDPTDQRGPRDDDPAGEWMAQPDEPATLDWVPPGLPARDPVGPADVDAIDGPFVSAVKPPEPLRRAVRDWDDAWLEGAARLAADESMRGPALSVELVADAPLDVTEPEMARLERVNLAVATADTEPPGAHAGSVTQENQPQHEDREPTEPGDIQPRLEAATGAPPGQPPGHDGHDPWRAFLVARESEGPSPFASPATANSGAPGSWDDVFAPASQGRPPVSADAHDQWKEVTNAAGYTGAADPPPLPMPGERRRPAGLTESGEWASGPVAAAPDSYPEMELAGTGSSADADDVVLRAFDEHARGEVADPVVSPGPAVTKRDHLAPLLGEDAAALLDDGSDSPFEASASDGVSWLDATGQRQVPQRPMFTQDRWEEDADPDADAELIGAAPTISLRSLPEITAADVAPAAGSGHRRRTLVREVVETGLLALLVFLAVRASFQNFKVDGNSMFPTLEHGEFLIVNKLVYSEVDVEKLSRFLPFIEPGTSPKRYVFHGPQRGDIVVLQDPRKPNTDLIKRVIGLPGETIEIREGKVFVNGFLLEEPYIKTPWRYTGAKTTVPAGMYFVMGDNRDNSLDSRSPSVGFVPKDLIIGKALVTYWPSDRFGVAPNETPTLTDQPITAFYPNAGTPKAAAAR